MGFVIGAIGKNALGKAFQKSVEAIEVRNGVSRTLREENNSIHDWQPSLGDVADEGCYYSKAWHLLSE